MEGTTPPEPTAQPPEPTAEQPGGTVSDTGLTKTEADEPEQPDVMEHVDVPCAGCGRTYGFDIKPNTATFTFQCRSCGTRSEWVRA